METPVTDIDQYIMQFPSEVQEKMREIRTLVHEIAPDAKEKLSWGMPTFTLGKVLIQFAGHKNHIGFYPFPETIVAFREKLTPYKTSKGGIQFPYDKPLPIDLIKEIIAFRVNELNP